MEARKRKCNFCLGVLSCFIVVFFAAAAMTIISKAPMIFLKQAEVPPSFAPSH
jgi:hypothetical protein